MSRAGRIPLEGGKPLGLARAGGTNRNHAEPVWRGSGRGVAADGPAWRASDFDLDGRTVRGWWAAPDFPSRADVVLLHGLATSGRLWEGVAPRLAAAGYRVLGVDLPGHGGSEANGRASLGEHRRWLTEVLAAMDVNVPEAHLVGVDYGALLAASMGTAWPGPARSVALSSCPIGPAWLLVRATACPPFDRLFYRVFGGRLYLRSAVGAVARDRFVDTFRTAPGLASQMHAVARELRATDIAGLHRALAEAGVPVLFLWGTGDRVFPWPIGWWGARVSGGRFETLPGRHGTAWEHPDDFAAALLRFWR